MIRALALTLTLALLPCVASPAIAADSAPVPAAADATSLLPTPAGGCGAPATTALPEASGGSPAGALALDEPEPELMTTPECGYGREEVGCCSLATGDKVRWRCKSYCCKNGWCGLLCDTYWCEFPCYY